MTDKEKILAKIELLLNEINYEPFTDEVLGRIKTLNELKSYIESLQEEPVIVDAPPYDYVKGFSDGRLYEKRQKEEPLSEFLNTESMIESYKQRLISQANGMKNSSLIDMCLASYKHGINEILDTLNLSNV
jgi:hypothetical protein